MSNQKPLVSNGLGATVPDRCRACHGGGKVWPRLDPSGDEVDLTKPSRPCPECRPGHSGDHNESGFHRWPSARIAPGEDETRLRDLCEKARPLPWHVGLRYGSGADFSHIIYGPDGTQILSVYPHNEDCAANREYVLAAANAVPSLLGRLAALRDERNRLARLVHDYGKEANAATDALRRVEAMVKGAERKTTQWSESAMRAPTWEAKHAATENMRAHDLFAKALRAALATPGAPDDAE